MKILKIKSLVILMLMAILIACGGTDEISEKMDEVKETVQEKIESNSDDEVIEKKETPNLSGELSVEVTVEVAPLTLSILEGKAQFNMRDGQGWIDAVDAQPVEQGWGVKTLAVSTAILNFEDGSMVLLEPTTEVEISLYQLINGGVSQGGERHVNVKIVNGGKTRADSAKKCLQYIKRFNPNNVLIHDAARPNFSLNLIKKLLDQLRSNDGVIPVTQSVDTIKLKKNKKVINLDRKNIYFAQTPQAFNYKILMRLQEKISNKHLKMQELK